MITGNLDNPPWAEIARFAPDACVHTAWVTAPGEYLESPANELFLEWSRVLLDRLAKMEVPRFVGLGTCIEYRTGPERLDEERTPIHPVSRYARCKDALRRYGEDLAQGRNLTFAWGRIFYPYGPGEHPDRLCSSIVRRLARGEVVRLQTPHSCKDYIFRDDLARAILRVVESGWRGCINLGTGTGVEVIEMARTLGRLMGCEDQVQPANPPAVDTLPFVVAEISRLRSLGWLPQTSIDSGLRQLAETMRP